MALVINPKYEELENFIWGLPGSFSRQGDLLYGGRNTIKVMSVVSGGNFDVNVKSFKVPNLINRLIYGNFRKSKARRSFEYANILLERGVNTPDPIAYMEVKRGIFFERSYYVSRQEEFDGMMREFRQGSLDGRESLLQQFARFTAEMHDKEVYHQDYSPGNILYKKDGDKYSFYLVDLNRMSFGKVSMEEGCRSFRRLWGSNDMICYIAMEYAKARGFDIQTCVDLTLSYHKEFWRKFSKRHKDKKPYIEED